MGGQSRPCSAESREHAVRYTQPLFQTAPISSSIAPCCSVCFSFSKKIQDRLDDQRVSVRNELSRRVAAAKKPITEVAHSKPNPLDVHSKANPLGMYCFYCYDALLYQPNGRNFAQRLGSPRRSRTSQAKASNGNRQLQQFKR